MTPMNRHYGMDWLRVGAFAILILYHTAMVFTPWGFHVKTAEPVEWLATVMLISNPWRLMLLFVVSGYASRALFAKSAGVWPYLASRNLRLLLPLGFGILVMVPPQAWVELTTQHGYTGSFGYFLTHDYFRFASRDGVFMLGWNHLWFVGYLWAYTVALCLVLLLPRTAIVQRAFDWTFAGWRGLVLPAVYLVLSQVIIFHRWTDTQDLIHDGIAHLAYFPAFLFGFGLAKSLRVLAGLVRWRWAALAIAVASYAFGAGVEIAYPGNRYPPQWLGDQMLVAHQLQSWSTVAALIGIAERYLNRDAKWRPMLTEAVFPFYLIHQTAIVLVEYWIAPLRLGVVAEFSILVAATVVACWAFYLIGREVSVLRPLIGLKRTGRHHPEARRKLEQRPLPV